MYASRKDEQTVATDRDTDDRDRHVTGPHAGYDRYGRFDHYYYRCERCGLESTDPALRRGCQRCQEDDDA